jgi:hypothetical protein
MGQERALGELIRALTTDSAYRLALTERLAARTIDDETVQALIAYARSRQTTMGQAMARKVLTDAGVSWEAL